MGKRKSPRKGSLQFWPRKRASKFLPRVNWDAVDADSKAIKGFICYKAGMMSAIVKDSTPDSMTKGKRIAVPVTILECPTMKILSVRFYKYGKVMKDVLADNLDKEIKKKVKISKAPKGVPRDISKEMPTRDNEVKEYDDIQVIFYSQVKKTSLKKTPDLSEIALKGSVEEKLAWVKNNLNKEISVFDVFDKGQLVDLRGLTKGKGLQGPVKRFGIKLKFHKSEKGRRRPGSLGPWHPTRVTFRAPQAGQLGMFTRLVYNNKIINIGKADGKIKNLKNFGDIKTDYVVVRGSIQGPAKRQLLMTTPLRETKKQNKKNFELVELK